MLAVLWFASRLLSFPPPPAFYFKGSSMTQNELMASLELASANQPFKRWKRGQIIDWVQDVVEDLID